jgi:hypothetical protein
LGLAERLGRLAAGGSVEQKLVEPGRRERGRVHRLEIENDLIAKHMEAWRAPPAAQFVG